MAVHTWPHFASIKFKSESRFLLKKLKCLYLWNTKCKWWNCQNFPYIDFFVHQRASFSFIMKLFFFSNYVLTIYKLTWIRYHARLFLHVANISFSLLYVQIICQPTVNPNASSKFFAHFVPAIIQLYFSRMPFVCTCIRVLE